MSSLACPELGTRLHLLESKKLAGNGMILIAFHCQFHKISALQHYREGTCWLLQACPLTSVPLHDLQDFVALVGAVGFTPMDFVLPIWLYLACRKPKGIWRWFNILIASFYSLIAVLGEHRWTLSLACTAPECLSAGHSRQRLCTVFLDTALHRKCNRSHYFMLPHHTLGSQRFAI